MTTPKSPMEIAKEVIEKGYSLIQESDTLIKITEPGLVEAIKEAITAERSRVEELEKEIERLKTRINYDDFLQDQIELSNQEVKIKELLSGIKEAITKLEDCSGWITVLVEEGILHGPALLGAEAVLIDNRENLTTLNSLAEKYK